MPTTTGASQFKLTYQPFYLDQTGQIRIIDKETDRTKYKVCHLYNNKHPKMYQNVVPVYVSEYQHAAHLEYASRDSKTQVSAYVCKETTQKLFILSKK